MIYERSIAVYKLIRGHNFEFPPRRLIAHLYGWRSRSFLMAMPKRRDTPLIPDLERVNHEARGVFIIVMAFPRAPSRQYLDLIGMVETYLDNHDWQSSTYLRGPLLYSFRPRML